MIATPALQRLPLDVEHENAPALRFVAFCATSRKANSSE
jgi:hypothetical protein